MSARDRAGIAVGLVVAGVLVGLLAFLLARGVGLERSAPPIEELTFERVELPEPGRMRVHVVNGGVDPVTIHQAIVDDAVWSITI
ncbi:MAG TPA: metal transporter, partial [Gemmatimonadota bacterium]|nr:metal transporter [Gemmatimonadota bacterium]